MNFLPHETILVSPIPSMTITNRRVRYSIKNSFQQSLSIQEISYIGITQKEDATYRTIALVLGVATAIGVLAMLVNIGMGRLVAIGAGVATGFFYIKYRWSQQIILQIQGRGGATINIQLTKNNVPAALQTMNILENAKLNLE